MNRSATFMPLKRCFSSNHHRPIFLDSHPITTVKINDGFSIIDAKVIYESNPSNDFHIELSEDAKSIQINFDYIDYEDGIVIQLYHTGNSNEDLSFTGKIKTVKSITNKNDLLNASKYERFIQSFSSKGAAQSKKYKNQTGLLTIVTGILLLLLIFYIGSSVRNEDGSINLLKTLFRLLVVAPYFFIGFVQLNRTIPKGIDVFKEEI